MTKKIVQTCLSMCILLSTSALYSTPSTPQAEDPIYSEIHRIYPSQGNQAMISVGNKYASEAGLTVLKVGGNAIDAAVTMAFVLAVTAPQSGNLGGGGFMMLHLADAKKTLAIDYREKAPGFAHENLFLDQKGNLDIEKTRYSFLSAGVPGTVAGLVLALENFGTIPLKTALEPAIYLAENGFIVDEQLHTALVKAKPRMEKFPYSLSTFYKNGEPYKIGETFIQPDLAWSLKQLARYGQKAFYQGPIAKKIDATMRQYGGLITLRDLDIYAPVIRSPITGTYRGHTIYSMPPPSSGGVHLIQILNTLEGYPLKDWGQHSAQTIHVMAESMKQAFADRAENLGDPDFNTLPIDRLTSKNYSTLTRKQISLTTALKSEEIKPFHLSIPYESNETNHFSIIDKWGNAVSNTYTLNFSFGSKLAVEGAGFLLNNQMDDFSSKKGEANAWGLIGSNFNNIEPQKRMLSSMSPTIVMKNDRPFLITGSPGGSKIISTVVQIISNVIDHNLGIAEAVHAPRFHHQWKPDVLEMESGFSKDTIDILIKKGHHIVQSPAMGSAQSILIQDTLIHGTADPRLPGNIAVGY